MRHENILLRVKLLTTLNNWSKTKTEFLIFSREKVRFDERELLLHYVRLVSLFLGTPLLLPSPKEHTFSMDPDLITAPSNEVPLDI